MDDEEDYYSRKQQRADEAGAAQFEDQGTDLGRDTGEAEKTGEHAHRHQDGRDLRHLLPAIGEGLEEFLPARLHACGRYCRQVAGTGL